VVGGWVVGEEKKEVEARKDVEESCEKENPAQVGEKQKRRPGHNFECVWRFVGSQKCSWTPARSVPYAGPIVGTRRAGDLKLPAKIGILPSCYFPLPRCARAPSPPPIPLSASDTPCVGPPAFVYLLP
jgi:hypothetical protein